jgi:hypothetical protein
MKQSSGAGQVNPSAVAATVRTVINHHQTKLNAAEVPSPALRSVQPRNVDYAVADLFGRCFLRVCYWVDVFASITRRGEPLPYVPFAHQPLRSLAAIEPAQKLLEAEAAANAIGTPPIANA